MPGEAAPKLYSTTPVLTSENVSLVVSPLVPLVECNDGDIVSFPQIEHLRGVYFFQIRGKLKAIWRVGLKKGENDVLEPCIGPDRRGVIEAPLLADQNAYRRSEIGVILMGERLMKMVISGHAMVERVGGLSVEWGSFEPYALSINADGSPGTKILDEM